MQLDPTTAARGIKLIAHDTVGSTNSEALALARAGERGPLWVTAARQTAGRGRRGNTWISEPGNLYASLLLTNPLSSPRVSELPFVVALAVHDAVLDMAPTLNSRVAVKWPNDLLVDSAKFAGILIETEDAAAVLGIGINCVHHPAGTSYPATDLAAAGVMVSPEQLFLRLSKTMFDRLDQWQGGAGFGSIRADWLTRAIGVGTDIRVRLPHRELAGHFQALDESGRLVLRLPDGSVEAVSAGEVFAIAAPDLILAAR
ncbi:MAG: BirA family transcriptional regulator [Alphaproteobacteria bacterium]|jgi:BirA family biotin operon repressor/biotin-[acetyl-CoA-carboxylase] ligase|nr:BirA family transcriptional regulator [Alphaproteobacteria bacterium]